MIAASELATVAEIKEPSTLTMKYWVIQPTHQYLSRLILLDRPSYC